MRLLDVHLQRLEFFIGDRVPPYAILSHTWGDDEVLFEHIRDAAPSTLKEMEGWKKVHYACTQARRDGYDWVWIDTCCIDKSSSAELSEAINSMFKWYMKGSICYAYLADVNDTIPESRFEESRWFRRGWTLQELIAPSNVIFYDSTWKHITSRHGLSAIQLAAIHRVTNLPEAVLRRDQALLDRCKTQRVVYPSGHDYQAQICRNCSRHENSLPILDSYIYAERMSWAAQRETTRLEDRAYSLLGLFGVSMPLLYGEGSRSFLRLQEEILKQSHDQSLLAYARPAGDNRDGLLAESPDLFAHSKVTAIVPLPGFGQPSVPSTLKIIGITARSIELEMLLCQCEVAVEKGRMIHPSNSSLVDLALGPGSGLWLALLPYVFKDDLLSRVGIILGHAFPIQGDDKSNDFTRVDCQSLVKVLPTSGGVDISVLTWNTAEGWSTLTDTNVRCHLSDADNSRSKTIRLLLSPSGLATSRNAVSGPEGYTPVSAATIIRLPTPTFPARTFHYVGQAPGTGTPASTKHVRGGRTSTSYDQFYIPPTSFEGWGLVCRYFPLHILGIICIRRFGESTPFLIVWGEATCRSFSLRHGESAFGKKQVWCNVISASDIEGWDQVNPKMIPMHALQSDVLGRLLRGRTDGDDRDTSTIKHSAELYNGDEVEVKRVMWLGATVYEIVVTMAKDLASTSTASGAKDVDSD